jgi:RimJ/RimL family protein N-acetyltransferase
MIEIRQMVDSDAEYIVEFNKGTDKDFLNQWAGRFYTYPITTEQITTRIKNTANTRYFTILMNNEVIGTCELDFINWDTQECSVCRFLLSSSYRGLGYGTKSLNLIVEYAFNELNMKKVKLSVFHFNTGAKRCYEKAGFIVVGEAIRPNGWVALQMEISNHSNNI